MAKLGVWYFMAGQLSWGVKNDIEIWIHGMAIDKLKIQEYLKQCENFTHRDSAADSLSEHAPQAP